MSTWNRLLAGCKYLSIVAALVLVGCDTIDRTQYRIAPPAAAGGMRASVTAGDRETVKALLQPIAAQLKLQDITKQSLLPNVIVHYQEMDSTLPIKLIAWDHDGSVLVDLLQGAEEPGETSAYRGARDRLLADLRRQFGERVSIVPYKREAEQKVYYQER